MADAASDSFGECVMMSDNAFGAPARRLLKGLRQRVLPVRVAHPHNSRKDGRMGNFASTAAWYVRYRPQYPPELVERLAQAAGLDRDSRVLDLGSGPGHVALPLAARVGEVVAVDVEAEMLAQVEAPNVRTVLGRAEDVDASWGRFDLVTAGRSFHWFDHAAMFERLPLVSDRLALLGERTGVTDAQTAVLEVALDVLGEERPHPARDRYADVLAASPYPDVELIEVDAERTWTAESLIGLAYSTSVASPDRLGDRSEEFERRVRSRFGDGAYRERVRVSALLGRRRDQ
jgi:SAM-dependent methyltransferase